MNPEIKKDPFSLAEDILILEKRLSIGNKWSEIIKEMPGRTENNVKNRFNMMYKNIKDEFIKNRNHQSVFVMQEKAAQNPNDGGDQIDEERLIRQLIEKKRRELEEKKSQQLAVATTSGASQGGADTVYGGGEQANGESSLNPGGTFHHYGAVNGENSESLSNTQMNEASRRTMTNQTGVQGASSQILTNEASNITTQTAQWAKQKEFLKLSNICQNKEKINHAIEKLIEACPQQINIVKRLVEYIQEDINRMVRVTAAYASNTSMGSTNNLMGTPGGGGHFHNRNLSPNQNTLEQLSNNSVSPGAEARSSGLISRMPYHQHQVIVGAGGEMQHTVLV